MSDAPGPALLERPPAAAHGIFGERFSLAERYAQLLCTIGVQRGLLGPREPERVWTRHLLNCAAISAWVGERTHVVDVGSGAGLPGIPLALARPDLQILLLEPMARRAAFLTEVVAELGLDVEVLRARAEELPLARWDAAVARAVAPLSRLIPLALPLLRSPGRLVALKGTGAQTEMKGATGALRRWPRAQMALERVAVGAETTTAVIIGLDEAPRDSGGFSR